MTKRRDLLQLVQVMCFFLGTQGEDSGLSSWRGEACAIDGYTNTKITQQDSGEFVCCVALTCPQGRFAVACTESDPSSTKCKECEGDTFMDKESLSTDSLKCIPRRLCSAQRGLVRSDEGSIVKDAVCQCDLERGYYNPEGITNPAYCGGPKRCPAGEELTMDGKCSLCGPGMFKAREGVARCQRWTHCEMLGFIISEHGSRTTDSTCVTAGVTTDSGMKEEPRTDQRKLILVVAPLAALVALLSLCIVVVVCWRRRTHMNMMKGERLPEQTDDCGKECKAPGAALLPATWIRDSECEQKPLVHLQATKNEDDRKQDVKVPETHVLLPRGHPSSTTPGPVCTGDLEVVPDADKLGSKQLDQRRDRSDARRNWFSFA